MELMKMKAKQCRKQRRQYDWMDCSSNTDITYNYGQKNKGIKMGKTNRFKDLPEMAVEDLESEVNFYQWLIDHEPELGGVEMKHRVWLEAIKIEIKRRGLIMERRIKLTKGVVKWEET